MPEIVYVPYRTKSGVEKYRRLFMCSANRDCGFSSDDPDEIREHEKEHRNVV